MKAAGGRPNNRAKRAFQTAFAAVLAVVSFTLGHHLAVHSSDGTPRDRLDAPGTGSGSGAASSATTTARNPLAAVSATTALSTTTEESSGGSSHSCPGYEQVDLFYDVVQQARPLDRSWAPLRRPGLKPVQNPNQDLYDQMWTQVGCCSVLGRARLGCTSSRCIASCHCSLRPR